MLVFLHFSISSERTVLFFAVECYFLYKFVAGLCLFVCSGRWGGPMIMLSARLKTFLVCLCTFLKKPAFSVSF